MSTPPTATSSGRPRIEHSDDLHYGLSQQYRPRALEAEAVCFLHKPFDGQSLIQCIDSALKRPSGKAPAE
jgi:hypothetical protein